MFLFSVQFMIHLNGIVVVIPLIVLLLLLYNYLLTRLHSLSSSSSSSRGIMPRRPNKQYIKNRTMFYCHLFSGRRSLELFLFKSWDDFGSLDRKELRTPGSARGAESGKNLNVHSTYPRAGRGRE